MSAHNVSTFTISIPSSSPAVEMPVWQHLPVSYQGNPILWDPRRGEFACEDLQLGHLIELPLYAEAALRVLVDPATGTLDLSHAKPFTG